MAFLQWFVDGLFQWEAVTAIATVGAVGVVWIQVGSLRDQLKLQTNQLELQAKQLKLQHYADYTKRYQDIAFRFPEDINESGFKLTKRRKDYSSTMRNMRAYFDLCFEEWDLNRRNLIDEEAWKVWEGGIRTALKKFAFKQAWKIIVESNTDYGEKFCCFIDECI